MNMHKGLVCFAGIIAVLFASLPVTSGQSRKAVRLRGNLSLGSGPSTRHNYNLSYYYTGAESLARPKPATGSGVLGSSIYRRQSYNRSGARSVAPVPSSHRISSAPRTTHVRYAPSGSSGGTVHVPVLAPPAAPPSSGLGAYGTVPLTPDVSSSMYDMFNDLAKGREEILADPGKPITTLVPNVPGEYRDLMEAGEKAFKDGQYRQALVSFKAARALTQSRVPGCMHALMQTVFALAKESYREPAGYLSQTLKDFPELPLVNFSPKDYYGRKEDYAQHLARLEARVKKNPKDADAQFLLAYLLWRDGDFDNAERAINLAIENASTKELKQAIDTLVQGVARTLRPVKGEPPKLQMPRDYPNAGLQLALPEGFKIKPLEKASQVLVASSEGQAEKSQTFTVSIFPVSDGVSASLFVDDTLRDLRRQGTFGDIKVTSRVTFNIHGIMGDGSRLDFSHEGKDLSAVVGCFIRLVRSPNEPKDSAMIRLAYVVSLETGRANKDSLPPVIQAIAKSIQFTDVRRPMDIPIAKGKELKDEKLGLGVVIPAGWVARKKSDGIAMGQIDFLLGGVASPMVHASAVDVPAGLDYKQCLQRLLKKYRDMGYTVELLSQGPAKLAGLDGYEFAIRRSVVGEAVKDPYAEKRPAAEPMTRPGPAYIEMGRFAFSPGSGGDKTSTDTKKVYFIDMVCYDDNVKKIRTVLNRLAGGFTILKPPAGG